MLALWQWIVGLLSFALVALGGSGASTEDARALSLVQRLGASNLSTNCESCHAEQVAQWRSSRHSVAFTNGLFRAEFNGRRTAWCASCHAPSAADPRTVRDDDPVALEGVGCVSCHLDKEGNFVSKTRSPNSPHATMASRAFGTDEFCGGCHEFNYPRMGSDGMPVGFQELAMQETVSQFRATSFAAKGGQCTDCHMRASRGSHLFPGSHDQEMLTSALSLESCVRNRHLRVAVGNVGAAHGVPTGGVNRHIVLRVWRSTHPLAVQEVFIGRRFAGSEEGKQLLEDSSLQAGEVRELGFDLGQLGGQAEEAINIELRYIYPLDEFAELAPGTRRYAIMASKREPLSEMITCQP